MSVEEAGTLYDRLTLKSVASVILDGTVGWRQPGASALKVLSVLPELLESCVGVGQRRHGGESSYGLHLVCGDASSDVVWNE